MMASTEEALRAARQQSARAGSAGPGSPRSARSGTPGSPRSARGAPRGPLQSSQSARGSRGASAGSTPPPSARHGPRPAASVETRPWRAAGLAPGPEAADALLRRLAADVGVRRVLESRNWDLEALCERPPRGAEGSGAAGPSGPVPGGRPFPGELWVRLRPSQRSAKQPRGGLRSERKARDSLLRELARRAAEAGRAPGSRAEIEAALMREAAAALREAGLQGAPADAGAHAQAHAWRPAPLQHPGSGSQGSGAPSPAPGRVESPASVASPAPEWGQGWVDSSLSSPAGSRRHAASEGTEVRRAWGGGEGRGV